MTAVTFDTYKIVQKLQSKGYSREQAEAFVEAIQEINFADLATKKDLLELKFELLKWVVPLILGLYAVLFFRMGVL